MRNQGQYIDGEWASSDTTAEVRDRWTRELIGTVAVATPEDAVRAVDAADSALKRGLPIPERVRVLHRTADYIEAHAEQFSRLLTSELGKPISASRGETDRAVNTLRYAAEEARRLPGETVPLDTREDGQGTVAFTVAKPQGIVAAVTPFNFPLNLVVHKVAPAIAAGCPVVLKPSSKTRLVAGLLVEAFAAAGLPRGFLNLVTGSPRAVVDTWQADERVAVLTFTGSSAVGWGLKAAAPRKVHILELGSNTAMVVAADADIKRAARDAVMAALGNSGQACISLQRVYVEEDVASEFISEVAAGFRAVNVGDPSDESTIVGPLVDDSEVARICEWIDEAVGHGATIAVGGERVEGSALRPTLVVGPEQSDRLIQEEVFGPVLSIVPVPTVDSGIEYVNDSRYGLNTSIYTSSLSTALRYAREGVAGSVLVNVPPSFRADHMPYGGVKDSGQGREGVKYAVAEMVREQLVVLKG